MHAVEVPGAHEVLEWIPDAVIVADGSDKIVYANRQVERLTGYRRRELVGRQVEVLLPGGLLGHNGRQRPEVRGVARLLGPLDSDFRLKRKDGTTVAVEISLGPAGPDTVAVMRDFTERRRMEEALEHRALHDPLTELANRTLFFDRLRQSIHSSRRDRTQVALVMLDVDGFKSINDRRGHAAGDAVLKELGARLRKGMRATDTAARIGGDEFAWILPRVNSRAGVRRMVKNRLASVEAAIVVGGRRIKPRLSAGVAMYPEDGRDADSLMRHADAAMYTDKRARR
jgi:diguanylate cyclase (GGDEF)-like protein/PAS domain S-box-containing protein